MKLVAISGTKNGVNVTFTLAEQPVTGGVLWVIDNGLIIEQVDGSPLTNQYTRSGATITMGLAPAAAEPNRLWAFVQTSIVKGLRKIPITGTQNNGNVTFRLGESVPSGSNVIIFFQGVIQEEVSALIGNNQFTISGTTITFNLAPLSTDVLEAYIEEDGASYLKELTYSGSRNNDNRKFTVSLRIPPEHDPVYVVLHNGLALQEVKTTPLTNQFRVINGGITIEMGLAPLTQDSLTLYIADFIPGARTSVSVATLRLLESRVQIRLAHGIDSSEVRASADDEFKDLYNAWQWSFLKTDGEFTTQPEKTAGTVRVVAGAAAVYGTSTAFASEDKGKFFFRGDPYKIIDVDATNQVLFLIAGYAGSSATGQSYHIWKNIYELDPEADDIISLVGPHWQLDERMTQWIDYVDPAREVTGEPYIYARRGFSSQGVLLVELWPVPVTRYHFTYISIKRDFLDDRNKVISDFYSTLYKGTLSACALIAFAKTGDARWPAISQRYRDEHLIALAALKKRDNLRWGSMRRRSSAGLLGRTDLDLGFIRF